MSKSEKQPEIVQQRLFYRGRKFNFEVSKLRLANGFQGDWESIRHPGGALAVPVTDDGKFILVRQYRFPIGRDLLEFPAGTVEVGEDPATTIKREIEEETGYTAKSWQSLGKFVLAPGYSDEYIYAFLARDLQKLAKPPEQDIDEDIEVVLMSGEEVEKAILAEELDAKSISSYFLAQRFLS